MGVKVDVLGLPKAGDFHNVGEVARIALGHFGHRTRGIMTPLTTTKPLGARNSRARKSIAGFSSLALTAGLMVAGASVAQAAPGPSWTNSTTGVNNVTLPDGAERILAKITGGGGAGGFADQNNNDGGKGGSGAQVSASLDVSKLDTLRVNVGTGGAIGSGGTTGGGLGGGATSITENGGTIGFVAGGGGGGSQANLNHTSAGSGSDGGDGGTANNGGGHDGSGTAGGYGGSKGSGGAAGGSALTCVGCTQGQPGTSTTGGAPSQTSTAGQGGYGGAGYGGGGGGGTPKDGLLTTVHSNGGGGAGGSRADGTGVVQSQFGTAANTGGTAGVKGGSPTPPTAGTDGSAELTWLVQPTNVKVDPGPGKLTVSWTEPSQPDDLGTPNYEVYLDGKATGKTDNSGSEITGLTNGQTYAVTVKVTAEQPTSPKFLTRTSSDTVNAGPAVVPGAPGTPVITAWGVSNNDGYVSLKWNPPSNNGGAKITDYHVQQQSAGTSFWFQTQGCARVTGTSCKVIGLVPDVGYKFRVIAENAIGNGAPSAASTQIAPHYVSPAPKNQSVGKCVRKPSKIALKNKTYPLLAPNCKTNVGQKVTIKVSPGAQAGKKKIRYAIIKIGKGKYKGYTGIRTYNVKVKKLKITWSAAAKARPVGQPTGASYKAWSTSKTYKVR